MQLLQHLSWRYATKQFDPNKKVSEEDLQQLMQAVRLSASSYGLQLYRVVVIENPELREQLRKVSWDQEQITSSSHLLVLCNYTRVERSDVDDFIARKAAAEEKRFEELVGYGDFIFKGIEKRTDASLERWTSNQTYIALGNLLAACAELHIDACPMEGFEAQAYNRLLGLEEQGLNAAVIVPIGYRMAEDRSQFVTKVRKPLNELVTVL
jgi:nitroreductase